MSQVRDSVMSLVTLVIFLVLMAIALVLYGGSDEDRAKLGNNPAWQKARVFADYGLSLASRWLTSNPQPNNSQEALVDDIETKMADFNPGQENSSSADEPAFWSGLKDSLKKGWEESDPTVDPNVNAVIDESVSSMIDVDWQTNETGAEIVFRGKKGVEYKLPVPFKLFSY